MAVDTILVEKVAKLEAELAAFKAEVKEGFEQMDAILNHLLPPEGPGPELPDDFTPEGP